MGEPRYLSISPDTGMVDWEAPETDDSTRDYLGHRDVAIPLVTGVYFDPSSFVETPVSYERNDGTQITSFDDGLALWAGVDTLVGDDNELLRQNWNVLYEKLRQAEHMPPADTRPPRSFQCESQVRFGSSSTADRVH